MTRRAMSVFVASISWLGGIDFPWPAEDKTAIRVLFSDKLEASFAFQLYAKFHARRWFCSLTYILLVIHFGVLRSFNTCLLSLIDSSRFCFVM